MFLSKKMLLAAFTVIAVTGCVTTDNKEQQEKITNLQDSLVVSQTKTAQAQTELTSASNALKISEDKITELTIALEKSKKAAKANKAAKQKKSQKVTHLDDKTILGQSEWVYVSTLKENYKGRIDTGAATSSINAVGLERFERDGKKWVRFNLTHGKGGKTQTIEAKIERIAKVRQSSESEGATERPVVKLHVRIGDVKHLTEFTLTNRLHMAYPMLIGRSFMRDVVLVDVSKKYIFPKYQAPTEK